MNRNLRLAGLAVIGTLAAAVAACDDDDEEYTPPVQNEVIVTNEADECPRADGTPCK